MRTVITDQEGAHFTLSGHCHDSQGSEGLHGQPHASNGIACFEGRGGMTSLSSSTLAYSAASFSRSALACAHTQEGGTDQVALSLKRCGAYKMPFSMHSFKLQLLNC